MKAEIKIPRGWRRLRKVEKIREGDMWPSFAFGAWQSVDIWSIGIGPGVFPFIRKRKARK